MKKILKTTENRGVFQENIKKKFEKLNKICSAMSDK